jgi:hypothetical protein
MLQATCSLYCIALRKLPSQDKCSFLSKHLRTTPFSPVKLKPYLPSAETSCYYALLKNKGCFIFHVLTSGFMKTTMEESFELGETEIKFHFKVLRVSYMEEMEENKSRIRFRYLDVKEGYTRHCLLFSWSKFLHIPPEICKATMLDFIFHLVFQF